MGNPRKGFGSAESGGNGGGEDAALHVAARSGDLHAVQYICSSNPLVVNSRDKHSRTPLHLAAWSGQTEVVAYLCKNKADVNAAAMDDMGAIHFASQKGHTEVVRTLLSSGVSVKTVNRKGLTPLHYAVQGSHMDLVKYLVRKGSSLMAKTKAGKTALDLAKSEEIRSYLVEVEQSSKKEKDEAVKEKSEDSGTKPSQEDKLVEASHGVNLTKQEKVELQVEEVKRKGEEDHENEQVKRKGEEVELQENVTQPKKAKIALNHLLAADDDDAQDENL